MMVTGAVEGLGRGMVSLEPEEEWEQRVWM